jgi:alkylation response protein AidB-like acyl-CoA dehydrogenase
MDDARDNVAVGIKHAPKGQARTLEIHYPKDDYWMSPAELKKITGPEVLAERVAALKPLIAANAAACEETRRPVRDVWDAISKTGAFYHFVPKRYGGLEFSIESFIDVMMPIGAACVSTCWSTVFSVDHNWLFAHFPQKGQDEFFGDGRFTSGPGVSVTVKPTFAKRVPGGFRLTGQFRFGSGVMNSNWVLLQAAVEGEDFAETLAWMAVPSEEVTVLDTWYVDGLAGTGSNDILVEDIFIPEYRTVRWMEIMQGKSPGSFINTNPLYRVTPIQFLSFCTNIPTLSGVRGLVDTYIARMVDRKRYGSAITQAAKSHVQVRTAKADFLVRSAEMAVRDIARTLINNANANFVPGETERLRLLAQSAHATDLAHEAMNMVTLSMGSSVHALSNPLQRMVRDIQVAKSHQLHEFDEMGEHYGRALLGQERITPVF